MSEIEAPNFVRTVISLLDELEIPYAVTGSWATFCYGEPRQTQDIDILIDPDRAQLLAFMARFQGFAMAETSAAIEAWQRRDMFNIIDFDTLEKADLICLKRRPYEQEKLSRRRRDTVMGLAMYLITPEDSILSKLVWMRESESERQLRDIVGTMLSQWDSLDWKYIEKWVAELRIEAGFQRAVESAEKRR